MFLHCFLYQGGTILAPFVILLGDINPDLPLAAFGTVMVLASFAFLLMQEPRDQPLLQTVQDMEQQEPRTIVTMASSWIRGRKTK